MIADVLFAPESAELKFLPEGPIDLGAGKFSWVAIAHGPGTLSDPEVVLDLNDVAAFPDGMVGTADGKGVIISFYNPEPAEAGETRYYDLDSQKCELVWETPKSPQNTCPLLIERDGKIQLVITTAVEHMTVERQAESTNAGALFIVETPFDVAPATTLVPLG
jgi:sugar lactone lactonase YvrE